MKIRLWLQGLSAPDEPHENWKELMKLVGEERTLVIPASSTLPTNVDIVISGTGSRSGFSYDLSIMDVPPRYYPEVDVLEYPVCIVDLDMDFNQLVEEILATWTRCLDRRAI